MERRIRAQGRVARVLRLRTSRQRCQEKFGSQDEAERFERRVPTLCLPPYG